MCQSAERGSIKYDRSDEPARRTWGFCFVRQICPNIYKDTFEVYPTAQYHATDNLMGHLRKNRQK